MSEPVCGIFLIPSCVLEIQSLCQVDSFSWEKDMETELSRQHMDTFDWVLSEIR